MMQRKNTTKNSQRNNTSIGMVIMIIFITISLIFIVPVNMPRDSNVNVWILDSQGKFGIPNIGASFLTKTPKQITCTWGNTRESFTLRDEGKITQHSFMFEDLKPNTAYWFSINAKNYSFTTPSTTAISFGLGGDAHIRKQNQDHPIFGKLVQRMTQHNLDYFFLLGDLVDRGYDKEEWQTGLDILANYTTKMPSACIVGNHDSLLNGKKIAEETVLPSNFEWISPQPCYRKIAVGDWLHIFILDLGWFGESFTSTQESWLRSELETVNKTDWTFILTHTNPIGSSDSFSTPSTEMPNFNERIADLVTTYDIDAFFSAHMHHLEHARKDNVDYFISGKLGGSVNSTNYIPYKESNYSVWINNSYGYTQVTVDQDSCIVEFYDAENILLYRYKLP